MYRTIAVGTDGSETASIAERVALELARTSGGPTRHPLDPLETAT